MAKNVFIKSKDIYDLVMRNLRKNIKESKSREKAEEKKKWRKIKSIFKINKLFLYNF